MAKREDTSLPELHGDRGRQWRWIWTFVLIVILTLLGLIYSLRERLKPVIEHKTSSVPAVSRHESMVTDFDGKMDAGGGVFSYTGPESEKVDYTAVVLEPGDPFAYEGRSLKITWSLHGNQFGGWGVGKLAGDRGMNISAADSFQMMLMGQNGGENFEVKLKDAYGAERAVKIKSYILLPKGHWTALQIPLADFSGVNLKAVENLNIGVSVGVSGEGGAIFIDNLKFVSKEIKP